MIIDVWVGTITPGKEAETVDLWKRAIQAMNRQQPGINSRVMRPETGIMSKIIAVNEFESHAVKEEFWRNVSDEAKALLQEAWGKAYIVQGSQEHYYYNVVE